MNRIKTSLLSLPSIVSEKTAFFQSIFKDRVIHISGIYMPIPGQEREPRSKEDTSDSMRKRGLVWHDENS